MEKMLVSGVASNKDVVRISIVGLRDEPGVAAALFGLLAKEEVNIDLILQSIGRKESKLKDITFIVATNEADKAMEIVKTKFDRSPYESIEREDDVAKVSIKGAGITSNPSIIPIMFEALYDIGANIKFIFTSEIKLTVLIDENKVVQAVDAIRSKFMLM